MPPVKDPSAVLLEGLSSEAAAIVRSPSRRLVVVAGAGAGKTEAMARRIAWWHAVDGVAKDRIVAFTFTERAAEEMKFRVRKYMALVSPEGVDPSLGGMYVGTIHSYCLNMLRRLWPREFHNDEIVDDVARYALVQQGYDFVLGLKSLQSALGVGKNFPPSRADTIEYFLRAYDLLNEYNRLDVRLPSSPRPPFGKESEWCHQAELMTSIGSDDVAEAFARSAARYYAYLRCRHFLDFSTSQSELARRLKEAPDVLAELRSTTTHLVVDEVQDVNEVQSQLRRLITGDSGWLTAVGDHRQAIYAFRGGRLDLMEGLAQECSDHPEGKILELTANYRSTPRVIELSNRWNFSITPPRSMASTGMSPGRIARVDYNPTHVGSALFDSRDAEAEWIADAITDLIHGDAGARHDDRDGDRGITFSDIAVLVRSSTDARTYQTALQAAGVPAVVRAGPDLFAQPEVLLFAAALALSAESPTFMGSSWNKRSLPTRIHDELGVAPDAPGVIKAAYGRLRAEGLSARPGIEDHIIAVADAIASRMFGGTVDRGLLSSVRNPELRTFLARRGDVRRVFPQTLFQYLLAEGEVSRWDVEDPRGRMAMFHLGQLSSLVTGIETPGWTTPSSFKHQVRSLVLWASKQASPDEAPLLVAPDAVTVSTIHSVKGLEFAAVFVADVASRRFPSQMAKRGPDLPFGSELAAQLRTDLLSDNTALDGERRLMYVALTRAERYLWLTTSKPSPFFKELEKIMKDVGGTVVDAAGLLSPAIEHRPPSPSHETRLVTSFSDLRYFLECPHDFYLRKVLGFTPTIDQAFGYGRGVHNLMREVHTDPAVWAELARDPAKLKAELEKLIEQGMFYLRHTTGEPARLMHEKGVRIVADYVTTYNDELADLTFEPERDFEVLLPEQNVLVTGAIDVVRRDDPPRVTIIDFKSGEAVSDRHQALDHDEMRMQVSIYAIAAKQELEYQPEQGLVRYLAEPDAERRQLEVPLDDAVIDKSRQQVAQLADRIQRRTFHATPTERRGGSKIERCVACDFESLCSLSLAKQSS